MANPSHTIKRFACFGGILLAVFSLCRVSPVFAAALPAFERLAPISANVRTPTGLALDRQGRVYVAETTSDRVSVFSQSGRFLHSISGQGAPVSLAVSANGHIYIGNKKTRNVAVYDSEFTFLFKLGRGDGEFGFPSAIAIDNDTNKIYVADRIHSVVKIYDSNGTFSTSLGQPGSGDGQLHHPASIAIDQNTRELVVLDQQQRPDSFSHTIINGSRIQYFDLDGVFLRGYSMFGYNVDAGNLVMPIHVAIDKVSRLYVTDARLQKVLVYDRNNTYLGLIDDVAHALRTPLGLCIGAGNRLYVSSLSAGRVEVYGIEQYSAMEVSPLDLAFLAVESGTNPLSQHITINNNGKTEFTWSAVSESSWLNPSAGQEPIPASGSREVEVGVNVEGLAPGIYEGNVDITINSGASETVTVTLTVVPNSLQVSSRELNFTAEIGTPPVDQLLSVFTDSIYPVGWTAAADQGWLSISKASGTTPDDVRVYVATENMTAGSYIGTITFLRQEGEPAPVEVVVVLNLSNPADSTYPRLETPAEKPMAVEDGVNKKWTIAQILPGTSLYGIWGSSSKDIFVVGAEGTILHNDGMAWSNMSLESRHALYSIWGSSESDVYAVGESGLVLHYNGSDWTPVDAATIEMLRDVTGTESDVLAVDSSGVILSDSLVNSTVSGVALRSIWGSSGSDIFVAGEAGSVLHYGGFSWTAMESVTKHMLNGIWGSSGTDVFAVGENGAIIHYDGITWSVMDSGTTETLQSVWGTTCSDVFAVGTNGLVLHYNGTGWTPVTSGKSGILNDVWVSSTSEMYAVGEDGIIISGTSKFPWLKIFIPIILANAASEEQESVKETGEELLPINIQE